MDRFSLLFAVFAALLFATELAYSEPRCDENNFSSSVCLNGVSSSVTNGAELRADVGSVSDTVMERAAQAGKSDDSESMDETALVDGASLWISYLDERYESDFRFSGSFLGYDADASSILVGWDKLVQERWLVGVAVGYQSLETDTFFNGGGQDSDGLTVAPYVAWLINDTMSMDVSLGYSDLEYDQDRLRPDFGTPINGDFDADRQFLTANLNATHAVNSWIMGGRLGFLYTEETQDAYVESGLGARTVDERDIDLTQMMLALDVTYLLGDWEPYAIVTYVKDTSRDNGTDLANSGLPGNFSQVQADDRDELQSVLGVRYFRGDWTTTLEYSRVDQREDFDSEGLMFSLRFSM